jgi:cystathionine beta-lyase/cystathionine gamma-synthase
MAKGLYLTAGVVAGSRKLIEPVWEYARVHGPVLHPMEAWLLGRGLKTYALRMRQHNQSGLSWPRRLRRRTASRRSTIPVSRRIPSTNSRADRCRAALAVPLRT